MQDPMKIPFNKPFIAGKELYYIAQAVMQEARLAGNGKFTQRCQKWLEQKLECPRAFLTHSCTAALEMAAILFELKPGDEVIMPSFTFVSTANAFVLRGAVPVFVDIKKDTLNIDESMVENAITPRTRAIAPVHYAGLPCAMDEILSIADRHKLWVVEDAAQALLSRYKDRFLGTLGHIGCLSFHETKNIISGEGGALLVNDPELEKRAEIIWEKGTNRFEFFRGDVDKYNWEDIGSSFLPGELVSAFLYAQLEQADEINANRREAFKRYYNALVPLEKKGFFRLPAGVSAGRTNGHLFYLVCRSRSERQSLIKHLRSEGIQAVFHYVPLHSSPGGRKYGRTAGEMAWTDQTSARLLRLPLFYDMGNTRVDAVVEAISRFFG